VSSNRSEAKGFAALMVGQWRESAVQKRKAGPRQWPARPARTPPPVSRSGLKRGGPGREGRAGHGPAVFKRTGPLCDVRRAAERYRQHYGDDAFRVIGDHMLAARFAPNGRHSRFLKQVAECLLLQTNSDHRS